MRLLVAGDLHGDVSTAGFARFDDVGRSLRACAELAKRERCDGFVQLGDLCDPGPRAHRVAALAIEVAADLASAGIWSRWLVGNHDVVEDGSGSSTLSPLAAAAATLSLAEPPFFPERAAMVWERPIAELLAHDVVALGLPHPPRGCGYEPDAFVRAVDRLEESQQRGGMLTPRVVLVFGHLTVEGIEPGSETKDMPRGREVRYPVEAIRERWGERAVMINGHYHRPYRRSQSAVVIPGALERLTRADVGNEPGCFILEV